MLLQAWGSIAFKAAHDRPADQIGPAGPRRVDHSRKPFRRSLLVVIDHQKELRRRKTLPGRPERRIDRAAIALPSLNDMEAGKRPRGEYRIRYLLALKPLGVVFDHNHGKMFRSGLGGQRLQCFFQTCRPPESRYADNGLRTFHVAHLEPASISKKPPQSPASAPNARASVFGVWDGKREMT